MKATDLFLTDLLRCLRVKRQLSAQDMKVLMVKQVNGHCDSAPRQREEKRVIFKLKTLAPSGMNIEFKFI